MDLPKLYQNRFAETRAYRTRVWQILVSDYFSTFLGGGDERVLELGCGYGDFINQVQAKEKFGMDLNPDVSQYLDPSVKTLLQDCSSPWSIEENSLDAIFTSNFFEHLPTKDALSQTLSHAFKALKPGGRFLIMGPNLRFLEGVYWDYFDHHLPLTDRSMVEALFLAGFEVQEAIPRFLPYTMQGKKPAPSSLIRLYLKLKFAWPFFGKQFFIVAKKPIAH